MTGCAVIGKEETTTGLRTVMYYYHKVDYFPNTHPEMFYS